MNFTTEYPRLTEIEVKVFQELNANWPVLLLWGVLGLFTMLADGVMLLLTKCTSGGNSPIFIFMKSLFVGDFLVGLFGFFKALLLYHMDVILMDCFLPESLFITASTSFMLTLLWLSIDSCMRLAMPLKYILHMHKSNVVMWMVGLWNASFIIGFIPQMDWTTHTHVCIFSQYYRVGYLLFVASLWILMLITCCVVQLGASRFVTKIRANRHLLAPTSREFRRYNSISITIRIELISWTACFLPIACLYIVGSSFSVMDVQSLSVYIIYIFPAFILRSFIISIIRGYRTAQIHRATRELKRQVTRILSRNTSNSLQSRVSSFTSSLTRKSRQVNHHEINSNHIHDRTPITVTLEDSCRNESATDNPAFEPETEKDERNGSPSRFISVHFEGRSGDIINIESEITRL